MSNPILVEGYAALYNVRSQNLGGFVEYIMPGAFDRALREKHDVRALVDHDPSKIVGRTTSGTLYLSTDSKGLKVRAYLPETSYARDLAASMSRGDVTQMSFGFRPLGEPRTRWDNAQEGGLAVHKVRDLDLFDVSVVTFPAYSQTSATIERGAKVAPAVVVDSNLRSVPSSYRMRECFEAWAAAARERRKLRLKFDDRHYIGYLWADLREVGNHAEADELLARYSR